VGILVPPVCQLTTQLEQSMYTADLLKHLNISFNVLSDFELPELISDLNLNDVALLSGLCDKTMEEFIRIAINYDED